MISEFYLNQALIDEIKEEFYDFLLRYTEVDENGEIRNKYLEQIRTIVAEAHSRSLVVSFPDVAKYNFELSKKILENPEEGVYASNLALWDALKKIHEFLDDKQIRSYYVRFKDIGARLKIRELTNARYINSFIQVKAIVVKATKIKELLKRALFRCDVCGIEFSHELHDKFSSPQVCPNLNCNNEDPRKFTLLPKGQEFEEYQELTIQELPEELPPGQLPQSINVVLRGDMAGKIRPGDRVLVFGILKVRPERAIKAGVKPLFQTYIESTYIEKETVTEEQLVLTDEEKRLIEELKKQPDLEEKIFRSIAPSIYGEDEIKKGIAALLFGGVPKVLPDGTKIRDTINILLVGDPGTGKSQILKYVAQLAPRAIYTSGKGASAAGLTAAVVKSEDEWILEAGVLVLADKGLACIDEFDKMSSEDRKALHEAMEQQTISVAKAGIVATLNARTSILAAANPKLGKYDENRSIAENINLPPTIISRFDLIFILKDKPDVEKDKLKARHIMGLHKGDIKAEPPIPPELMKKYILYAKEHVTPKMTDVAAKKIEEFYLMMRNMYSKEGQEEASPIPITARQLEALVRLAEAHAKMLLKEEVDEKDADFAINVVRYSLEQVGRDPESGKIDTGVIYTGVSHTRRSKYHQVIEIIKNLQKEEEYVETGVPLKKIIEVAKELKIDEEFVKEVIKKEMQNGTIFEPRYNHYKFVPL